MIPRAITAVVVCYNTPGLISKAVKSINPYVHEVIIINSSDINNPAYKECSNLTVLRNVKTIHTHKNIGHGPGLNLAIQNASPLSQFIVGMDSDTVLLDVSLLMEMLNCMDDKEVYGCGRVLNFKVPYLYLPFFMISREMFFQYPKFVHGGAPGVEIMKAIHNQKKLINIPNLMNKIYHKGRATREIAGHWRKTFGGKPGI